MNTAAKAALAVVGSAAALVGAAALSSDSSVSTASPSVPAPANLRAYEVGPYQIKVSYGPSVVGPLSITPAPNGRSATIRWGGAKDDLSPLGITYTFTKNGTTLWKDRQQTYAVVGFTLGVRRFTTCVTPHSQNGYGPNRCVTWTAP